MSITEKKLPLKEGNFFLLKVQKNSNLQLQTQPLENIFKDFLLSPAINVSKPPVPTAYNTTDFLENLNSSGFEDFGSIQDGFLHFCPSKEDFKNLDENRKVFKKNLLEKIDLKSILQLERQILKRFCECEPRGSFQQKNLANDKTWQTTISNWLTK